MQIGVPRRIFLLRNDTDEDTGKDANNVYINPSILSKSKETKRGIEGCLSLPGMGASFMRPKSVTLRYMDIDGELHTEVFEGFWARAVMHEMDHLDGTLITQHLELQIAKQPRRTKFGMQATSHRNKQVARRRAQKKRARKTKQRKRAMGR